MLILRFLRVKKHKILPKLSLSGGARQESEVGRAARKPVLKREDAALFQGAALILTYGY